MTPAHPQKVVIITGAQPETAGQVVDLAVSRFGRMDTLVNNAGVYIGNPFTDYTVADYEKVTAVNLAGRDR